VRNVSEKHEEERAANVSPLSSGTIYIGDAARSRRRSSSDDLRAQRASVPRLMDLVQGRHAALGYALGALGGSVVTIADRWLTYPRHYASATDVLLHGAAEVASSLALSLTVWAALTLLARVRLWWPHLISRRAVLVMAALVMGVGVYAFIVRPSVHAPRLSAPGWLVVSSAATLAAVIAADFVLRRTASKIMSLLTVFATAAAAVLHVAALHRYERLYGNLQLLLTVIIVAIAAIAANLLLMRLSHRSRARHAAVAALASALALLAFVEPSPGARRAVLEHGGTAKWVTHGLWRALDRDDDGSPSVLWGTDPDDDDARATSLSHKAGAAVVPAALASLTGKAPNKNLLWIVIDTARADVFEQCLAADHAAARAAAEFVRYPNYRSCGSRTNYILQTLLGDAGCIEERAPRGETLSAVLRRFGYMDQRVSVYDGHQPRFSHEQKVPTDAQALEEAQRTLQKLSPGPQFLMVHLAGGHSPYKGTGATERERYASQLCSVVHSALRLAATVDATDWATVIMGDHGEALGEHGVHGHGVSLYEEILKTPFMIRSESMPPRLDHTPLGCADVPSRVLFSLGLMAAEPPATQLQFASLDIRRGTWGYLRDAAYRSLQRGSLKVIWEPYLGVWEMYDLARDPNELVDLVSSRPDAFRELRTAALNAAARCGANRLRPH
jgi:hypothetical protein